MSNVKKAVCYWRVSTEEQMSGTSPDGQRDACLLMAAQMGAQVVAVCSDPGLSGTRYTSRPGLMEALRLIETGEANVLLATKVDRLGRSAKVILDVVERVQQAGGEAITSDAAYDRSPMGQMLLTLLAGMAELERNSIRERTVGGRIRRAQEGLQPSRSRSPYGLHCVTGKEKTLGLYPGTAAGHYLIVPGEADTVREIFRRYVAGESLRSICRWLNESGVAAARGGEYWRPSALHKLLVNPVYAGNATFGKHQRRVEEVGDKTITRLTVRSEYLSVPAPALVDQETWNAVQERLTTAQQTYSGNPERKHTLGGLLRCPLCGRSMNGTRRERPNKAGNIVSSHYYQCPDARESRNPGKVVCNRATYQAADAEKFIRRGMADVVRNRSLLTAAEAAYQAQEAQGYSPEEHRRVEAALRAVDARERATAEAQVQALMAGAGTEVFLALFGKIAEERQALKARLRTLEELKTQTATPPREGRAEAIAQALADVEEALQSGLLTDAQKHDLLARVVEKIVPAEDVEGYRVFLRPFDGAAAHTVHNIIMVGPPGSGKTMLARRVPSVLPPMSLDEALDVTKIYSVGGLLGSHVALMTQRPFRSPHHSVSNAALAGGGSTPRPGEISLAHHGVLFLDELPEFRRDVLEVLRQPLEDGHVTIARVAGTMTYPAQMMLIAAMNPCPCGYYGDTVKACTCSSSLIQKYLQRISGPLLDRIDIHIEVPRIRQEEMLHGGGTGEPSATIRERVVAARDRQAHRFTDAPSLHCNAHMQSKQIKQFCPVGDDVKDLLRAAIAQLGLSARAYDRILKLSRTVADLDDQPQIGLAHVAESIQYRALDRKLWG